MGQSHARQRLNTIKENVKEITEKIKSEELTSDDRNRSHDILLDYIKELNFILSKSLRASRIRKVEKLIIIALQELATFEASVKNIEPRLKAKSMQTLHDIEKKMKTINATLKNQNLTTDKETVNEYKKRISLIEDFDQEVGVTKNEVLGVVYTVEKTFNELEMEEKLKQAEEKHYQKRLDLSRFVGVTESNCYKNHREHLLSLKEEIDRIRNVSERIVQKKNYLLFNIDNNLIALEKKVKENEENIKKQIVEEEIFRATTPVLPSQSLTEGVVYAYSEFEKSFSANCSLSELQDIFRKLSEVKVKIDQKLKVLENQIQIQDYDPFLELVPVKESDYCPVVEVPKEDIPNPVPRVIGKSRKIEKFVKELEEEITKATYTRESETYAKYRKQLEDCRRELEVLPLRDERDQKFVNSIFKHIGDVLILLDNNVTNSRGQTGDLLIDIMSISGTINELGRRILSITTSEECNSFEESFLENLFYLKKIEIPAARSNVREFRDYVIIQIESNLSNLEQIKRKLQMLQVVQAKNDEMLTF